MDLQNRTTYNLQIGNSEIQRDEEETTTTATKTLHTKGKPFAPLLLHGTKTNDFHRTTESTHTHLLIQ